MRFCGNITVSDLAGRSPLGPKPPKTPAKARKRIPKQSPKRKAYRASSARLDGLAHMERIAAMPCLVCGAHPVEIHHATSPRDDMQVLPLCAMHHRREFGPGAYHFSPKAFRALHGEIADLLKRYAPTPSAR